MRLVTRPDFDGLASGVLLVERGLVDSYRFVHPKDIQDGKVEVTPEDVLANVPYCANCGLWFDHHASERERIKATTRFDGASRPAPSTAQVIWDYYGGEKAFDKRLLPLMEAVNKSDRGQFTQDEILNPKGWILLSFIMDPRTGLARFSDYRVSNLQLMEDMIQYCRTRTIEEILDIPDVKERVKRYFEQQQLFKAMLLKYANQERNVIVTDLRPCDVIYAGNRFLVFALFPEANIELRIMWGREKRNVVFTCGHNIINRSSRTNVGRLMLKYGGGGHEQVGTCQVAFEHARRVQRELLEQLHADG